MKRFLTSIIIFILLLGIFVPFGSVHAVSDGTIIDCRNNINQSKTVIAPATCPEGYTAFNQNNNQGMCVTSGKKWENNTCRDFTSAEIAEINSKTDPALIKACTDAGNIPGVGANNKFQCNEKPPAKASTECSATSPFSLDCIMKLLKYISYAIMVAMSWLLWLSGSLLDFVLNITIIQMSAKVSNMQGIDVAWKVVRDVLNMAFIFLLLYNAILVIVSRKTTDDIKKIVVGIILTALLINFSMFFTKVIIDASNVATIGFYKSIQAAGQETAINTGSTIEKTSGGLSGAFMNSMRMTGFFSASSADSFGKTQENSSLFITWLGGAIMFLVLAFVFFAVSAMFIIRFMVLILLLMLSPIGFIGFGLPQMKKYQDQWWETLMGQAIFAPLYMILTWIILTLVGSPGFLEITKKTGGQPAEWSSLFTGGSGDSIGLILNFVLIIGFIIMSLTIAKTQATRGSSMIGQATGKLTAFAGGAMMGGSASLLRNTAGWAGNKASNSGWLKDKAKDSFAGKWALKASNKAATGSFDIREASLGGKTTLGGQMKSTLGTDFGSVDPKKQNFRARLEAKADKEKKFAELLKPSDEEKKKHERETAEYLASDEYKKTPEYKNAEKEKEENAAKLKTEADKEEQLRKEISELEQKEKSAPSSQAKFAINKEIEAKKLALKEQQNKTKQVKSETDKNNTAQTVRDEFEKEQKKDLYTKRVNAYADHLEGLKPTESVALSDARAKDESKKTLASEQFIQEEEKKKRDHLLSKEYDKQMIILRKSITDEGEFVKAKAAYEKAWISNKKKELIAMGGGQSEIKEGKYVTQIGVAGLPPESANEYTNTAWLTRFASSAFKAGLTGGLTSLMGASNPIIAGGAIFGGSGAGMKTKENRRFITKGVRGLGDKSKKEKAKDNALEYLKLQMKEDEEVKKKDGGEEPKKTEKEGPGSEENPKDSTT